MLSCLVLSRLVLSCLAVEGRLNCPVSCPIDEHTIPVAVNVVILAFGQVRLFCEAVNVNTAFDLKTLLGFL